MRDDFMASARYVRSRMAPSVGAWHVRAARRDKQSAGVEAGVGPLLGVRIMYNRHVLLLLEWSTLCALLGPGLGCGSLRASAPRVDKRAVCYATCANGAFQFQTSNVSRGSSSGWRPYF